MKNNKILLLLLLFPLTGCSCSSTTPFSWSRFRNNDVSMDLQSYKFAHYNFPNFDNAQSMMDKLKNVVTKKGSTSDFVKYYNSLDSIYANVVDSYIIASTKYYARNDADFKSKSAYYLNLYTEIAKFFTNLETDIYNSSDDIKKMYFGNMSDEQILARLNTNTESVLIADYNKIFSEYQDEGYELYLNYTKDLDSNKYLTNGFQYFLRYIDKANELINQISYNNYLDFSYATDYSRDYKIDDALKFVANVKKYLVPIYNECKKLKEPENLNKDLYEVITKYNFCNSKTDLSNILSKYAGEFGGNYLECYNKAFNDGYYCFSNSYNSMSTAYNWNLIGENDAVLYFSRNYQDILGVVHEFGHYYSTVQNNSIRKGDAYDLQETYSQGNEYTFLDYLVECKKDDPNLCTYSYLKDNKFYNEIYMIIQDAAIAEIENFAFTTPNLDYSSLVDGVNNILSGYDGAASNTYFMAACLASPCYYISYATSVIEAMQFAEMDFLTAKDCYTKLIENSDHYSMIGRWEQAGLSSPFEEQTIKSIADKAKEIREKYS